MTTLWADNIAGYRKDMIAAQARARETLEGHGVRIVTPTAQELNAVRAHMLEEQDRLVTAWKIDPAAVKQMTQDLES
jgi:hypothetical protein